MAVKTEGLGNKLRVIIANKSKEIFDSYSKDYVKMLGALGSEWRQVVRDLLSVPHRGMKPNADPFPHMRTGGLQDSILAPKVRRTKTSTRQRGFYYEATLQFTPMFKRYYGNKRSWRGPKDKGMPKLRDKGDVLDQWMEPKTRRGKPNPRAGKPKPFAGWKQRAAFLFNAEIEKQTYKRRGRHAGMSKVWAKRDFFSRATLKRAETLRYELGG